MDDLQRKCDLYELLYLRATEGARAANKGLARLQARLFGVESDLVVADARIERLKRENAELLKRLERLSLRILKEWGEK